MTPSNAAHDFVPLSVAAQRLRWSWGQTFDAILKGRLAGERRKGRWYVSVQSVDGILHEGKRNAAPVA